MLLKMEKEKKIQGIHLAKRGPSITHLLYADDTILFFKATLEACLAVQQVLNLSGSLA